MFGIPGYFGGRYKRFQDGNFLAKFVFVDYNA